MCDALVYRNVLSQQDFENIKNPTIEEVKKIIEKMKNKAPGTANISSELIVSRGKHY